MTKGEFEKSAEEALRSITERDIKDEQEKAAKKAAAKQDMEERREIFNQTSKEAFFTETDQDRQEAAETLARKVAAKQDLEKRQLENFGQDLAKTAIPTTTKDVANIATHIVNDLKTNEKHPELIQNFNELGTSINNAGTGKKEDIVNLQKQGQNLQNSPNTIKQSLGAFVSAVVNLMQSIVANKDVAKSWEGLKNAATTLGESISSTKWRDKVTQEKQQPSQQMQK
jgi:hypothetical protein